MNTCMCTASEWHKERLCICSCHERIRREAALAGWKTRRASLKPKEVAIRADALRPGDVLVRNHAVYDGAICIGSVPSGHLLKITYEHDKVVNPPGVMYVRRNETFNVKKPRKKRTA